MARMTLNAVTLRASRISASNLVDGKPPAVRAVRTEVSGRGAARHAKFSLVVDGKLNLQVDRFGTTAASDVNALRKIAEFQLRDVEEESA